MLNISNHGQNIENISVKIIFRAWGRMPEKDQKIEEIKSSIEDKIKTLVLRKTSGKILVTIEVNMSQGFIGAAFIENNTRTTREKIF
jgi:hypothetical protein